LDGIIECLPPDKIGTVSDVFSANSGAARLAWKLARIVYRGSARGGSISRAYSRLRTQNDFNRGGLALRVMGTQLRRTYLQDATPLVVAHPLLVAILKDRQQLIYQHGEVATPRESWVLGRHRILVPLADTADRFIKAGFDTEQLFVSGLCIEPALTSMSEAAFNSRVDRLSGADTLCGAFFSSGAEPREHVEVLAAAAASAVTAGGRVVIFARRAGRLGARISALFAAERLALATAPSVSELPEETVAALLCLYEDRRELNEYTASLFGNFDYFVAPSHERTQWALGLGLPMFIVDPPLGSFSPLNREFLLASSAAKLIGDVEAASRFGAILTRLHRAGDLGKMAEAGFGRFDTRGFQNIAQLLQNL
jgi:hypothetical protein